MLIPTETFCHFIFFTLSTSSAWSADLGHGQRSLSRLFKNSFRRIHLRINCGCKNSHGSAVHTAAANRLDVSQNRIPTPLDYPSCYSPALLLSAFSAHLSDTLSSDCSGLLTKSSERVFEAFQSFEKLYNRFSPSFIFFMYLSCDLYLVAVMLECWTLTLLFLLQLMRP